MKSKMIRIATRGSRLALWQAHYVAEKLKALGYDSALTVIKTQGDAVQDRFLHEIGGKGLFVRELELSLANGDTDIAVHSLKDLPAKTPKDFTLAAILKRHSPNDVLVYKEAFAKKLGPLKGLLQPNHMKQWGELTLASASLRRQGLIRCYVPGAKLEPVRGNVDTRIAKLSSGDWDGLILASASLERLGLSHLPAQDLDPQWFIPAPAQGALVIETLAHSPLESLLKSLECADTAQHVRMERQLLQRLGGDCTMPFGCHISYDKVADQTIGRAVILNASGDKAQVMHSLKGHWRQHGEHELVDGLFSGLFADGAEEILQSLRIAIPELGNL